MSYFLQWVNGLQSLRAFDYDPQMEAFIPTPQAAGKAQISISDGIVFTVDGVDVVSIDTDGIVHAARFTEKIISADYPRLEVYRQVTSVPERIAYFAKSGDFYCRGFFVGELPDTTDKISLLNLAAFWSAGIKAAGFKVVT